jgi:hypothetical protein
MRVEAPNSQAPNTERGRSAEQIRFWLRELRTPQLLVEVAQRHAALCRSLVPQRRLLAYASSGRAEELERALISEEAAERDRDRLYWLPLRQELETLRHAKLGL